MDNNDVKLLRTFWRDVESLSCDQYAACFVDIEGNMTIQEPKPLLTQETQRIKEHLKRILKALPIDSGNGIVEVPFLEKYKNWMEDILDSRLKHEGAMETLYQVIARYMEYNSPIAILVYHAFVDMPHKASDGARLEDSEEVYEHIICLVCETKMQKKELAIIGESEALTIPDRVIKKPITGFIWPVLSGDDNTIMIYNDDPQSACHKLYERGLETAKYRTTEELQRAVVKLLEDRNIPVGTFMRHLDDLNPFDKLTGEIFLEILLNMGVDIKTRVDAGREYETKVGEIGPDVGQMVVKTYLQQDAAEETKDRRRRLLIQAAAVIEDTKGSESDLARELRREADRI